MILVEDRIGKVNAVEAAREEPLEFPLNPRQVELPHPVVALAEPAVDATVGAASGGLIHHGQPAGRGTLDCQVDREGGGEFAQVGMGEPHLVSPLQMALAAAMYALAALALSVRTRRS